jgi:hypothetical protein
MEPQSGSNPSANPVGTPVFQVTTRTGPFGPFPNPEPLLTLLGCTGEVYWSV